MRTHYGKNVNVYINHDRANIGCGGEDSLLLRKIVVEIKNEKYPQLIYDMHRVGMKCLVSKIRKKTHLHHCMDSCNHKPTPEFSGQKPLQLKPFNRGQLN